jgi:nucleolar protein 4
MDSDEEQELESDAEDQAEEEPKSKPANRFPEVSSGTTLFVRNLLFETTEVDLKEL